MHRTRIKICGVTRAEDARVAAELGADFVGMVLFADGPRRIDLKRAREIVGALQSAPATPVGLFVDAPTEVVKETCDALGLRIAQLHGHESPDDLAPLKPLRIWKAVRVDGRFALKLRFWAHGIATLKLDHLEHLVLETADARKDGGSGRANDWTAIRAAQAAGSFANLPPMIAAGGLAPRTVGQVIRTIRPWAVDVSSGVESAKKGIKSKSKIANFIAAVRDGERAR